MPTSSSQAASTNASDPNREQTVAPAPQQPESKPPLQTVDRALSVLLSYNQKRTEWSVSELALEFDLDKSTAQRLLATLARRGFLHADDVTRRYRLGPAMWRMATIWQHVGGMAALVEPVLSELAFDTERTAVFTLPDGAYVRCVAAVNGRAAPIRDHPLIGELYPAHAGATSRAYFAFLSSKERKVLLYDRPIARFTDLTLVDEQPLEKIMLEVARAGFAYSEGEYDFSTRAVGVPVMLMERPIGSVGIAETKTDDESDICDQVARVQRAAQDISRLFSSRPTARPQRNWRKGVSTGRDA